MSKIKGNRSNYIILTRSNLNEWSDWIALKAQADYKLGSVFKCDKYDPPSIESEAQLILQGFTPEQAKDIRSKLYVENKTATNKYDEGKKGLYSFIFLHISAESAIPIKADTEFKKIDKIMCPLSLWIIIKRTHLGGITSKNARINKNKIIADYQQIKMGIDENIVIYHNRFIYAAKNYHTIKNMNIEDKGNDVEVAWAFYGSLPSSIYGEFMVAVENKLTFKTMSDDVSFDEMYGLAYSFSPPSLARASAKQITHAVYAVAAGKAEKYNARLDDDDFFEEKEEEPKEQKWSYVAKGKGAAENKGAGGKEKKENKAERHYRIPRPIEQVQCHECWKLGHYKYACPLLKEKAVDGAAVVPPK
jgi:hypothetical protein